MAKKLLYGKDARDAIMRGVDQLANAVKVTLGPKGRLVVIGRRNLGLSPHITKDGVTVANHVDVSDPMEQLGSDIIREAAQKTADSAGDGTTTATLLAQYMFHVGMSMLLSGASPVHLRLGIEEATAKVIAEVNRLSLPVNERMVYQVASISANGDESVGKIVAEAVRRVGKDGIITVQESRTLETHLDVVNGLQLPCGYLSPYFITDVERIQVVQDDALILLYEGRISTAKSLIPLLNQVRNSTQPLLVIAGDYDAEGLQALVINRLRGGLPLCAIRSGAFGDRRRELMRDIAVMTGGKAITEDLGLKLENVRLSDLGQAKRVVVDEHHAVITEGHGDSTAIESRVSEIRKQIESAEGQDKVNLQARLAGFASGVAVIRVGAATETEMRERKDRVEDAVYACKAAVESGIVPGGGVALLRAAQIDLGDSAGAKIVRDASSQPIRQIAENAGQNGIEVQTRVLAQTDPHYGYNAASGTYENLIESGVIDPAKVVAEALKNAASVAAMLLSTECLVSELPVEVSNER